MDESFLLERKNFSASLASSLGGLRSCPDDPFSDVTLVSSAAAGRAFRAHKVILAAGSDYFRHVCSELPTYSLYMRARGLCEILVRSL